MSSHRKKSRKKTDPGPGGRRRSRSANDYRGTIQEVGSHRDEVVIEWLGIIRGLSILNHPNLARTPPNIILIFYYVTYFTI